MKQIVYIQSVIISIFLMLSCSGNTTQKSNNLEEDSALFETSIEFKETSVNFGKLKAGEVVSHRFLFTNTGKHNLKISNVDAACGCTAPSFTNTIVKPGEQGYVDVVFNSQGRSGNQSLSIRVYANTIPVQTVLHIFAEVEIN